MPATATRELAIVISARDRATKALQRLKQVGIRSIQTLAKYAQRAAIVGIGALTAAILKSVKTSADFEAMALRLEQVMGSAQKAKEAMQEFVEYSARTPFQIGQIIEAAATLEAFGASSRELIPAMGDLAVFMGVTIPEAANAFGRAFAAGAGAADIFRERGVLNLIKMKTGIEDLTKLTLPEFRKTMIETFTDPNGRVAGGTAKLADTLKGKWSTLIDAITLAFKEGGDVLLEEFKSYIDTTTQWINENRSQIKAWATELKGWMRVTAALTKDPQGNLNRLGDTLAFVYKKLKYFRFNIWALWIQVSTSFMRGFERIDYVMVRIDRVLRNLGQSIKATSLWIAKNFVNTFKNMFDAVRTFAVDFSTSLASQLKWAGQKLLHPFRDIPRPKWEPMMEGFKPAWDELVAIPLTEGFVKITEDHEAMMQVIEEQENARFLKLQEQLEEFEGYFDPVREQTLAMAREIEDWVAGITQMPGAAAEAAEAAAEAAKGTSSFLTVLTQEASEERKKIIKKECNAIKASQASVVAEAIKGQITWSEAWKRTLDVMKDYFIQKFARAIIDKLWEIFALQKMIDIGTRAISAGFGLPIPGFQSGTPYVPYDMIARLHQGEAIVPAAQNPFAGGQPAHADSYNYSRPVSNITVGPIIVPDGESLRDMGDADWDEIVRDKIQPAISRNSGMSS